MNVQYFSQMRMAYKMWQKRKALHIVIEVQSFSIKKIQIVTYLIGKTNSHLKLNFRWHTFLVRNRSWHRIVSPLLQTELLTKAYTELSSKKVRGFWSAELSSNTELSSNERTEFSSINNFSEKSLDKNSVTKIWKKQNFCLNNFSSINKGLVRLG